MLFTPSAFALISGKSCCCPPGWPGVDSAFLHPRIARFLYCGTPSPVAVNSVVCGPPLWAPFCSPLPRLLCASGRLW